MTITVTVEDGTGIADANSYVSADDADTFFANRGDTAWTGTDDQKAAALIRGCQYLETLRYKGVKAEQTNELKWPRDGVQDEDGYDIDTTEIPKGIINAQLVLAKQALANDLQPALERGGAVKRERVGQLEVEYFDGAPPGTIVTEAWAWLSGWVLAGNDLVRG